jgi:hypothetical protein
MWMMFTSTYFHDISSWCSLRFLSLHRTISYKNEMKCNETHGMWCDVRWGGVRLGDATQFDDISIFQIPTSIYILRSWRGRGYIRYYHLLMMMSLPRKLKHRFLSLCLLDSFVVVLTFSSIPSLHVVNASSYPTLWSSQRCEAGFGQLSPPKR